MNPFTQFQSRLNEKTTKKQKSHLIQATVMMALRTVAMVIIMRMKMETKMMSMMKVCPIRAKNNLRKVLSLWYRRILTWPVTDAMQYFKHLPKRGIITSIDTAISMVTSNVVTNDSKLVVTSKITSSGMMIQIHLCKKTFRIIISFRIF